MAGAKIRFTARNIIVALLGIYLIWVVASYAWNFISSAFLEINGLEKGVLEETLVLEGILIRDEKVLTAPGTGKINWLMPEGERVRLKARLAKVRVEAVDTPRPEVEMALYAPVTGMLYYQVDGLENVYTPDFIKQLDRRKISSVEPQRIRVSEGEKVEKGQPVAKLINNHAPVYYWGNIKTTPETKKAFEEGKRYTARAGEKKMEIYISRVWVRDGETEFLIQIRYLPRELNTGRKVTLELITGSLKGYIIPKGALVYKDEKPGVYICYKEKVYWKNIKIVGEIDGKLAIDGLNQETRYIANPRWTGEGKYVSY